MTNVGREADLKMKISRYIRPVLAAVMGAVIIIFCCSLAFFGKNEQTGVDKLYRLTLLNGKVALYRGSEYIASYDGVSPENLPSDDRTALENGILFETREQAERAVEDYDG